MIKIAINGINGRMGASLTALLNERDDCAVTAGVDSGKAATHLGNIPLFNRVKDIDVPVDVIIDFSTPAGTEAMLRHSAEKAIPCVICTTGLGEATEQLLRQTARKTAVFYSANMSLGINVLTELVKRAQKLLSGFDIEIIEKHHHNKIDAPSGTALALANAINDSADEKYVYQYNRQPLREKRHSNEIGIHAVRGGSIVGEHDVLFAGPSEVLTLSHAAYSRDVFANGAIAAALYIAPLPPGMYNMNDMMESI